MEITILLCLRQSSEVAAIAGILCVRVRWRSNRLSCYLKLQKQLKNFETMSTSFFKRQCTSEMWDVVF